MNVQNNSDSRGPVSNWHAFRNYCCFPSDCDRSEVVRHFILWSCGVYIQSRWLKRDGTLFTGTTIPTGRIRNISKTTGFHHQFPLLTLGPIGLGCGSHITGPPGGFSSITSTTNLLICLLGMSGWGIISTSKSGFMIASSNSMTHGRLLPTNFSS